jgi:hypothetical protein
MEDKSQSVYTQWDAHWSEELKTNTKDPLSKSLRQTFYRNSSSIQVDISSDPFWILWLTSLPSSLL